MKSYQVHATFLAASWILCVSAYAGPAATALELAAKAGSRYRMGAEIEELLTKVGLAQKTWIKNLERSALDEFLARLGRASDREAFERVAGELRTFMVKQETSLSIRPSSSSANSALRTQLQNVRASLSLWEGNTAQKNAANSLAQKLEKSVDTEAASTYSRELLRIQSAYEPYLNPQHNYPIQDAVLRQKRKSFLDAVRGLESRFDTGLPVTEIKTLTRRHPVLTELPRDVAQSGSAELPLTEFARDFPNAYLADRSKEQLLELKEIDGLLRMSTPSPTMRKEMIQALLSTPDEAAMKESITSIRKVHGEMNRYLGGQNVLHESLPRAQAQAGAGYSQIYEKLRRTIPEFANMDREAAEFASALEHGRRLDAAPVAISTTNAELLRDFPRVEASRKTKAELTEIGEMNWLIGRMFPRTAQIRSDLVNALLSSNDRAASQRATARIRKLWMQFQRNSPEEVRLQPSMQFGAVWVESELKAAYTELKPNEPFSFIAQTLQKKPSSTPTSAINTLRAGKSVSAEMIGIGSVNTTPALSGGLK